MMKQIQSPGSLHLKIVSNVLQNTKITFFEDQGYINAKDFQIQSLFEYEKLKNKGLQSKKKKISLNVGV